MTVLAQMQREPGRRVLMPRRDERFLGSRDRARARARERRRRVFVTLLEGIGLTGLIGAFPPLRAMWVVTAVLVALLGLYVWLLVQLRAQAGAAERGAVPARARIPAPDPSSVVVLPAGDELPSIVVRPRDDRPAAGVAG